MAKGNIRVIDDAETDVIVVGAEVAGSAVAYALGKDGRRVRVIERDLTEPNRIAGEILQPGGYLKLIELGLQDCVEDIDSQRVLGYALFHDGKSIRLPYPLKKNGLDLLGKSFHNGRFIQRLREKAASLPSVQLDQGTVTSLLEENGIVKGVAYKNKTGGEYVARAHFTIVSDGCFSNLRRTLCHPKIEVLSHFVGLILKNCRLPYPNYSNIVLAIPSPVLFYPISSTEIRCLVDVPGEKPPSIANGEMENYLKTVVAPQIPVELHDAFMSSIEEGQIKITPNKSMPASPYRIPGAILIGDALNMRHPLTGGGMTIALSDVVLLRDLLKPLPHLNNTSSLLCLESFYSLRKPVASTINALAGTIYMVLSAPTDKAKNELRRACFDYLSFGGVFMSTSMALLSGLNSNPWNLVYHFFAVALYSIGRLLFPFPSPKRLWVGARLISGGLSIVVPVIKAEGMMPMFFLSKVNFV